MKPTPFKTKEDLRFKIKIQPKTLKIKQILFLNILHVSQVGKVSFLSYFLISYFLFLFFE